MNNLEIRILQKQRDIEKNKIKFYGQSPPSADSRTFGVSYKRKYCTKYWFTAKSSLPRKKCG